MGNQMSSTSLPEALAMMFGNLDEKSEKPFAHSNHPNHQENHQDTHKAEASVEPVMPKKMAAPETAKPKDASRGPLVHVLLVTLDYQKTPFRLTCSQDGDNIATLLSHCDNVKVHELRDDYATVPAVLGKIQDIGGDCQAGDHFLFFYAGHGSQIPDRDGDEADRLDEAFCLVDKHGKTSQSCWLTDDRFATELSAAMPKGTKILILADCCHSGTIGDLEKPCWKGLDVVTLTGCTDKQTSGDTGVGGCFTHSFLLAYDDLINARGPGPITMNMLHDRSKKILKNVFHRDNQDVTMQSTGSGDMEWPLKPRMGRYAAPMRASLMRASEAGRAGDDGDATLAVTVVDKPPSPPYVPDRQNSQEPPVVGVASQAADAAVNNAIVSTARVGPSTNVPVVAPPRRGFCCFAVRAN